ncbi:hypothetical protein SSTU70S_05427 [Stutzerimonas stutzeri]
MLLSLRAVWPMSFLLLAQTGDAQRRQQRNGEQHGDGIRVQLDQPERLGEHPAADDQEVAGRVELADEGADAFHRRDRVEQPGELDRRQQRDDGGAEDRRDLAVRIDDINRPRPVAQAT